MESHPNRLFQEGSWRFGVQLYLSFMNVRFMFLVEYLAVWLILLPRYHGYSSYLCLEFGGFHYAFLWVRLAFVDSRLSWRRWPPPECFKDDEATSSVEATHTTSIGSLACSEVDATSVSNHLALSRSSSSGEVQALRGPVNLFPSI